MRFFSRRFKCVEKASKANCPVCLEDLHSSIVPSHVPPCSHLIHRSELTLIFRMYDRSLCSSLIAAFPSPSCSFLGLVLKIC